MIWRCPRFHEASRPARCAASEIGKVLNWNWNLYVHPETCAITLGREIHNCTPRRLHPQYVSRECPQNTRVKAVTPQILRGTYPPSRGLHGIWCSNHQQYRQQRDTWCLTSYVLGDLDPRNQTSVVAAVIDSPNHCSTPPWFGFVIIVAIRFLTSVCEWCTDAMFVLSSSLYVLIFVWDFFCSGIESIFLVWQLEHIYLLGHLSSCCFSCVLPRSYARKYHYHTSK